MIIYSAIKKDGVIYTGKRHHNIINNANPRGSLKGGTQGFVDENNNFFTREEAAEIAFNTGQIQKKVKRLFSEDLW